MLPSVLVLLPVPDEEFTGLVLLTSDDLAVLVPWLSLLVIVRVLSPLTLSLLISELLVLLLSEEPLRVEYSRELYLEGE
jgi:hypothetical protein